MGGAYYGGEAATAGGREHIDPSAKVVRAEATGLLDKADRLATLFGRKAFSLATCRIQFTGKGYRVRKARGAESYRLSFGRSHRTSAFGGGLAHKKLSKNTVLLFTNDRKVVTRGAKTLVSARGASPFTKRGLRLTRQLMIKRPGKKVST
jgi:hypothetical protein